MEISHTAAIIHRAEQICLDKFHHKIYDSLACHDQMHFNRLFQFTHGAKNKLNKSKRIYAYDNAIKNCNNSYLVSK